MVKRNKIAQTVWSLPLHKQLTVLWGCISTKKERKRKFSSNSPGHRIRGREKKKRAFHRRKLTHWCCPCSSLGRLAANIQLLVTFISYRALLLLLLLLRQQRLFLGLRVQHAAATPQGETQPVVDKVQKHFPLRAIPPAILSARRFAFTQRPTKLENNLATWNNVFSFRLRTSQWLQTSWLHPSYSMFNSAYSLEVTTCNEGLGCCTISSEL